MASAIDATKPVAGSPTTQSVRDNFASAASEITALQTTMAASAPLANPILTGDPKAPTPATADNDTSIATTAFVKAQGYVTGGPYLPTAGGSLSGSLTVAGSATLNGSNLSVAGPAYFDGADVNNNCVVLQGGYLQVARSTAVDVNLIMGNSVGYWEVRVANNGLFYILKGSPGSDTVRFLIDGGGLTYNTTGAWNTISDPQVKTNQASYTRGLGTVTQLQPITYAYNGLGGSPDDTADASAPLRYGLDARATQAIMPELVQSIDVKLKPDDTETTEILTLANGPLVYAFINCITQINSRLAALEAAAGITPPAVDTA
jgi:hypothetical protein